MTCCSILPKSRGKGGAAYQIGRNFLPDYFSNSAFGGRRRGPASYRKPLPFRIQLWISSNQPTAVADSNGQTCHFTLSSLLLLTSLSVYVSCRYAYVSSLSDHPLYYPPQKRKKKKQHLFCSPLLFLSPCFIACMLYRYLAEDPCRPSLYKLSCPGINALCLRHPCASPQFWRCWSSPVCNSNLSLVQLDKSG